MWTYKCPGTATNRPGRDTEGRNPPMHHQYTPAFIDRFWAKVNRNGPIPCHRPELGQCWLWTGTLRGSSEYGHVHLSRTKALIAHRVSYELAHGFIPSGLLVCHKCDVRLCVRPGHLFVGTHLDNMADMVAKGRGTVGDLNGSRLHPERLPRGDSHPARRRPDYLPRGEQQKSAKLTDATVTEARLLSAQGVSRTAIAGRLGVSVSAVSLAVRRKTWRHVP
jgi:hypothetical protein